MLFGRKKGKAAGGSDAELPVGIGRTLEEIVRRYKRREALRFEGKTYSYQELDEQANRVAGGLQSLGIGAGDRVALMLPNIPEFAFSFYGIQKIGAVAVPFNTMYKGREISFILKDSAAKAIICLSNFANLINEIKEDCPDLEHVIVTGQRTLVFVDPDATVNVQMVVEKTNFESADGAFRTVGAALVDTFKRLGVDGAWYKHQGAVRVGGKKIATILLSEIENLYIVNVVAFLAAMDTDPLFKVLWVPPEIKDKAVEPSTSVAEVSSQELGDAAAAVETFKNALLAVLNEALGVSFETGKLTRDELLAYEKNRALAGRL